MKKIFFAFIFAFVLIFNNVYAQTVDETIDWINITLTKMSHETENTSLGYSAVVIKDSVTNELHLVIGLSAKSPKDDISAIVHIPLKKVLVCDVEKDKMQTILFTIRSGTMDGVIIKNGVPSVMNYNSYQMVFESNKYNKSIVKRLVKAFQNLIKISGGKVPKDELFL